MSATNKTTYYNLPIFIGTDTPTWLGDWNDAMSAIDTAINNVHTEAQNAQNVANTAQAAADANTQNLQSTNEEVNTIKQAVQNYDSILDFEMKPIVVAPNNVSGNVMFVQNTNKTLSKMIFDLVFLDNIASPTTYTYTRESGTATWWDLATIEDNAFNLNQSSLPNYQNCLTLGYTYLWATGVPRTMLTGATIRAWFDGTTTHIGIDLSSGAYTASNLKSTVLQANLTAFLSGSVYNPDPVTE